jgi:hypothetical protein
MALRKTDGTRISKRQYYFALGREIAFGEGYEPVARQIV